MPRRPRSAPGGVVYHVLNRGNAGTTLFADTGDYRAFEQVLEQADVRLRVPILAYCVMPTHWHLVLWPRDDGDLSRFMSWLTMTHAQRWHVYHNTVGSGHVYQGRFKCFPVQNDYHLLIVCRYVERNALRAGHVRKAEEWRWCSLWRRTLGSPAMKRLLSPWPVEPPSDWLEWVNRAEADAELEFLRPCLARGAPFGSPDWCAYTASHLRLDYTVRPRGRPRR